MSGADGGLDQSQQDGDVDMSNLNDVWAIESIAKGTIIEKEKLLDKELSESHYFKHIRRSENATCILRKKGKYMCLVSSRSLTMGESLTLEA